MNMRKFYNSQLMCEWLLVLVKINKIKPCWIHHQIIIEFYKLNLVVNIRELYNISLICT